MSSTRMSSKRIGKASTLVLTQVLGLWAMADAALAQRPPAPGQGPPQLSIERAWAWLTARPGVMIALVIIIAVLAYMIATRRKSST